MVQAVRKALAGGFNGEGGGGDGRDEATTLFRLYKDKPAPFTGIATDKLFRDDLAKQLAMSKVLEYLACKSFWVLSAIGDMEDILSHGMDEYVEINDSEEIVRVNEFRSVLLTPAFDQFAKGMKFEEWKKTIRIADGKVSSLNGQPVVVQEPS